MELKDKVLEAFNGKVVRKDLANKVKGNLPVPTYVLEYLLGQYCACDDEKAIEEGLEKVKSIVSNNYVKFGGYLWRIVRINGDGSIRLILYSYEYGNKVTNLETNFFDVDTFWDDSFEQIKISIIPIDKMNGTNIKFVCMNMKFIKD